MSYFPSPYPEQPQATTPPYVRSCPSTPRQDTPVSAWQEATRPSARYDARGQYTCESDITWPAEEPRGLGFLALPVSQQAGLPTTTFESFSSAYAPSTWPDQFQHTNNVHGGPLDESQPFWNTSYDVFAPVLASTAWEDMTQSSATVVERSHPSPEETDYSRSPAFSCASTPYASSDGIIHTAASPAVKIEDHSESGPSAFRYLPHAALFNDSKVINPEHLIATPPPSIKQPSVARSMPSTPQFVEVKHVPSQSRPGARRAYSTEDTRIYLQHNRKKRSFTTPEDSTCSCDLCGKLFKRNYNLRSHMVIHDPNRPRPFPCPYADCTQRFARKTDLTRHERSKHSSERPWHCHFCNSSFPRKDTLERHVNTGCSQRPEIKKRPSRLSRRVPRAATPRRALNHHFRDMVLAPSPLRRHA